MHQAQELEAHYYKMDSLSHLYPNTQKRYCNIERELLKVVVIIECLHHYIFGHHFTVHTDHSPLVNLFQKCLNGTSPWLQQLLLRLNQYQVNIEYVTRKCVPLADCLSRLIDIKTGRDDPSLNLQITDVTLNTDNINWNQIKPMYMNDPTMVSWQGLSNRVGLIAARTCLMMSKPICHMGLSCIL